MSALPTEDRPQPDDRSWDTYLSCLEGAVDTTRRDLRATTTSAGGVVDVEALQVRVPRSRLDPVDAARATAALEALHELVRELQTARGGVRRELGFHRTLAAGRRGPAGPLYLDGHC